ncbi:MAG: thiamine diphosphokinase [Elusimicrobia bacterium]|nr:thiamine diphosphokinase [Elusimicrobiota bacterium]MDE2237960.1 thiamine diphosphokinase [Elusimicrobiota bacterium]MDE2424575.1 thiamine diphosphokinase [Elusimicrobiota bacterium]
MTTARRRAALILLNGEIPEPALVRAAAKACRGIICADGGLRHAVRLGLRPDFVAGDMDSLPRRLPPAPALVYWCDFDENRSDFDKALALAARLGCRRAYVAGALGGRADHALVNLGVFERYRGPLELLLLDRGLARLLGPGRHSLPLRRGRFSLLAAPSAVLTLGGARYPLRRFALHSPSRGLGNSARGRPLLTVHRGRVWLIVDKPAAA